MLAPNGGANALSSIVITVRGGCGVKMAAKKSTRPDTPRDDKAGVLSSFYLYLGGRIDSVGRRASFMMALLGSFLGVASASITHGQAGTLDAKLAYIFLHPSILVGIVAMAVLLASEIAKIKSSDDLLSRIAFSGDAEKDLQKIYVNSTINELLGEMIKNTQIVGGFLKKKVRLYNVGSTLFVVSVTLFVFGL